MWISINGRRVNFDNIISYDMHTEPTGKDAPYDTLYCLEVEYVNGKVRYIPLSEELQVATVSMQYIDTLLDRKIIKL